MCPVNRFVTRVDKLRERVNGSNSPLVVRQRSACVLRPSLVAADSMVMVMVHNGALLLGLLSVLTSVLITYHSSNPRRQPGNRA